MTQTTTLKFKPKLEVTFKENDFEILDHFNQGNSGVYAYSNLNSAIIDRKFTNWFLSLLKSIPVGRSKGDIVINKSHLKIELKNQTLKLSLKDSDMAKAESVKQKLNEKKLLHNNI